MYLAKLESRLRDSLARFYDARPKRLVTQDRLLFGIKDRYERHKKTLDALYCTHHQCKALDTEFAKPAPKIRGPEEKAAVGERVAGPKINVGPADVLKAFADLERRVKTKPGLIEQIRERSFPAGKQAQLEWALAYAPKADHLNDPLWSVATNDSSPALVAYVHGVVAACRAGLKVDSLLENRIVKAQRVLYEQIAADPTLYAKLEHLPFPVTEREQLIWAIGVLVSSWDPDRHPIVMSDSKAAALVALSAGVLAKKANNETSVEVLSERRTMTVDGDTRVFSIHQPPGVRPPGGWPTVVFFHGSYGGYAPEQSPDYQALNAIADQHGFQVVYPVGSPQDRADLIKTGRGMLNWDPIGAGPGGANDRFVHELINSLINQGEIDKTRVFVAGHSQGGFYTSNLLASYPQCFAAAAIFGAGAGSVASRASFDKASRKTPLFLHTGADDIHLPMANDLALKLQAEGYGSSLKFARPPNRGHELLPSDFEKMFAWFAEHPSQASSPLGTLDGKIGEAITGQVYRAYIDLLEPPDFVANDPEALETMRAIAEHPFFDIDGDPNRLSADEWRLAAYRLAGWPASMQQAISDLRRYFVVVPPPDDARVDLDNLPSKIAANQGALAALQHISATPALDLDGYPRIVSERELKSAEEYAAALPPKVRDGLKELRALLAQ